MGRTIPSFRIASSLEEKEWKPFILFPRQVRQKMLKGVFQLNHYLLALILQQHKLIDGLLSIIQNAYKYNGLVA
ncbi:MAG: hypothetical protein WBF33_08515 [Candidatus Nitrosopolaris sp.]|jgi:hypothetical protein